LLHLPVLGQVLDQAGLQAYLAPIPKEPAMTINVKVGQAKTHLSELLVKAEAGEEVIISRGDQPIAKLVAIRSANDAREVFKRLAEIRTKAKPVTQDEIRQWRDEGRP
jgi:antitoxin (DNA-binding transcriptional repressor) of toxin-antitoxin stability system